MTHWTCLLLTGAAAGLVALSSPARADVTWTLSNVAFGDGVTMTGSFNADSNGYLTTFDFFLSGGPIGTAEMNPGNSTGYAFGGNFWEVAFHDSNDDLFHVQFQADQSFTGSGPIALNDGTNIYDGNGHYGRNSGTVSATAAPEPMSVALLTTGVIGLSLRRARRTG